MAIVAALLLGYCLAFAYLTPLTLQDNPNHLTRVAVLVDLIFDHGRRFGNDFSFQFLLVPYIFGDLVLAVMTRLFGTSAAFTMWAAGVFASLPIALLTYVRAKNLSFRAALLTILLSLYLSTDAFFLMGFVAFRLAVAWVFFALAAAELLRQRGSTGMYAVYVAVVVAAYLTHFAATVFMLIAIGTTTLVRFWQRSTTLRREIALMVPIGLTIVWQFLVANRYRQPDDAFNQTLVWPKLLTKLGRSRWDFYRYTPRTDELLLALLGLALILWVWRRSNRSRPRTALARLHPAFESWALAAVFYIFYLVMPTAYSEGGYVDLRALAFIPVFAICGILQLAGPSQSKSVSQRRLYSLGVALLLVAINLAYTVKHLHTDSERMHEYRVVAARIPPHSRVLPIYTLEMEGIANPFLHAGSFATMDEAALEPYLFSGDAGSPMKYFRYRHRPYAPNEFWYVESVRRAEGRPFEEGPDPVVDWDQVHASYDYFLVTKPFDPALLPLKYHAVAENAVAVLLKLE